MNNHMQRRRHIHTLVHFGLCERKKREIHTHKHINCLCWGSVFMYIAASSCWVWCGLTLLHNHTSSCTVAWRSNHLQYGPVDWKIDFLHYFYFSIVRLEMINECLCWLKKYFFNRNMPWWFFCFCFFNKGMTVCLQWKMYNNVYVHLLLF